MSFLRESRPKNPGTVDGAQGDKCRILIFPFTANWVAALQNLFAGRLKPSHCISIVNFDNQ